MFLQPLARLARQPLVFAAFAAARREGRREVPEVQRLPRTPDAGEETRPMIFRSEAFAEDLLELLPGA
jgi:hypothetical protein